MKRNPRTRARIEFRHKALVVAVMATLFPAAHAEEGDEAIRELTQPTSFIEVGVRNVDQDSFKFGEYSGLNEKGSYFIGNIDILKREGKDSARYWIFRGTELGSRARNVRAETGNQGSYRAWIEYDQLPKYYSESAQTIFDGAGGTLLTLPSGFSPLTAAVSATTPAGVAARGALINPFLKSVDIDQERKALSLGFTKNLSKEWELRSSYKHETKEGNKLIGGVIGNSGGNPRSVLIPEPVDYTTDQFEFALQYNSEKFQFEVAYYLSRFDDSNRALTWQNPFAAITGWASAAGFPTGQGQLALPPDNQFQQFSAKGGYNFSGSTRLSFSAGLGKMTQNEAFLPYTVNPALTLSTPLPRSSLDGKIDTTLLTLSLTSNPLPKLNVRANYRYDDRDNKTPQAQYIYIGGDSTNQATTLVSDRARTSLPLSYRQSQLKVDADYEFLRRTKVNFGFERDDIKRTFTQVNHNKEDTWKIGLRRSLMEDLSGAVSFSRAQRSGSNYEDVPYLESYSPQFTTPQQPYAFDDHPYLRKFMYADRDREKTSFNLTASPDPLVALQARVDFIKDEYNNSILGLKASKSTTYSLDASFTPKDNLVLNAYYTHENIKSDQNGRSFGGANRIPLATPLTSANDWNTQVDDEIETFGLGMRFNAVTDKIDVGADYTNSRATGKINTTTGAALTTVGIPLPDIRSRTESVQLTGKYKVRKDLTVKLSITHQRLSTSDWAYDNLVPATIPNVITTGQVSPNYTVNVIGLSLLYRF